MDINDALDYLRRWAQVNAQEVYGSFREFVPIRGLENEIDRIKRIVERER